MFDGADLTTFLELADYCTVNDYEAKLLTERTGKSLEELAGNVRALIVTPVARVRTFMPTAIGL